MQGFIARQTFEFSSSPLGQSGSLLHTASKLMHVPSLQGNLEEPHLEPRWHVQVKLLYTMKKFSFLLYFKLLAIHESLGSSSSPLIEHTSLLKCEPKPKANQRLLLADWVTDTVWCPMQISSKFFELPIVNKLQYTWTTNIRDYRE